MPRVSKSQWDFSGELFPVESLRRVYSVSELTGEVRRALEKQFGRVWVGGEITNFRAQASGHIYFTLKDAGAQLGCVLFRNDSVANREALQDGAKVVLQGEITVYEARGQYQLHVEAIELQGVGALQAAFERLKQKLNAEGLFAPERKRALPRFPRRVGIVTSPTGAALRDVLHVAGRRNPSLEFVLAPCLVQGAGAAADIARAIADLNAWSVGAAEKLDLILVTRGGGSLEDLWAFNEEAVARAIFKSALPVVSAVGHEIDFTISDFVADLRAATPSAAAELLTEDVFSAARWIRAVPERIRERLRQRFEREQARLFQLAGRLQRAHPRRMVRDRSQRLDDLGMLLERRAARAIEAKREAVRGLADRLGRIRPGTGLRARRASLDQDRRRLEELARRGLSIQHNRLAALGDRLRLLAPQQVLSRGYAIATDAQTGKLLRDAAELRPGQSVRTRLASGQFDSRVESAQPAPPAS